MRLAVAEPLLATVQLLQPRPDLVLPDQRTLFDLRDAGPLLLDLALDLGAQRSDLLARRDSGLPLDRLGLTVALP